MLFCVRASLPKLSRVRTFTGLCWFQAGQIVRASPANPIGCVLTFAISIGGQFSTPTRLRICVTAFGGWLAAPVSRA